MVNKTDNSAYNSHADNVTLGLPRAFHNVTLYKNGPEELDEILKRYSGKKVLVSCGTSYSDDGLYDVVKLGHNNTAELLGRTGTINLSLDNLAGILIPEDDVSIAITQYGRFRKLDFRTPSHLTPRNVLSCLVGETVLINQGNSGKYNTGIVESVNCDGYKLKMMDTEGRLESKDLKVGEITSLFVPEARIPQEFLRRSY